MCRKTSFFIFHLTLIEKSFVFVGKRNSEGKLSGYKILIILKSVQSWVRNFVGPAQIFFIVSSSCQSCHLVSLFSFLSFWFAHVEINVGSICSLLLSYFFYLTCQLSISYLHSVSSYQTDCR